MVDGSNYVISRDDRGKKPKYEEIVLSKEEECRVFSLSELLTGYRYGGSSWACDDRDTWYLCCGGYEACGTSWPNELVDIWNIISNNKMTYENASIKKEPIECFEIQKCRMGRSDYPELESRERFHFFIDDSELVGTSQEVLHKKLIDAAILRKKGFDIPFEYGLLKEISDFNRGIHSKRSRGIK